MAAGPCAPLETARVRQDPESILLGLVCLEPERSLRQLYVWECGKHRSSTISVTSCLFWKHDLNSLLQWDLMCQTRDPKAEVTDFRKPSQSLGMSHHFLKLCRSCHKSQDRRLAWVNFILKRNTVKDRGLSCLFFSGTYKIWLKNSYFYPSLFFGKLV